VRAQAIPFARATGGDRERRPAIGVERVDDRLAEGAFVAARDRDAGIGDPVGNAADRIGDRGAAARLGLDADETERFGLERGHRNDRCFVDRVAQRAHVEPAAPRDLDSQTRCERACRRFVVAGPGDEQTRTTRWCDRSDRAHQRAQSLLRRQPAREEDRVAERARRHVAHERAVRERRRRYHHAARVDVVRQGARVHVRARDEHRIGLLDASRHGEPVGEMLRGGEARAAHTPTHERSDGARCARDLVADAAELRIEPIAVRTEGAVIVDAHDPAVGLGADDVEHGRIEHARRDDDPAADLTQEGTDAFRRFGNGDAVVTAPRDLDDLAAVPPAFRDRTRDEPHVEPGLTQRGHDDLPVAFRSAGDTGAIEKNGERRVIHRRIVTKIAHLCLRYC